MFLDSGSPCSAPFNLKRSRLGSTVGGDLLKCLMNQMKMSTGEQ